MHDIKKIGNVFTSKSVGTGPSSYKKRIYRVAVSQRLRNTGLRRGAADACLLGSNPAGGMDAFLLRVFVLSGFLRLTDHSSRGVLPSAVCLSAIVKPEQ